MTASTPAAAPILVPVPGDIVGIPPYRAEGGHMHVLLLEGDRATQQREVCDLLLNHPSGGALTYRAISDKVMLAALYVDTMRSLDPVDGRKGVIREWDLGFWTAVHGGPTHDKRQWKFGWVPSFLFVDTASAMASGREVYGYPKTLAAWRRRQLVPQDASVELCVLHYAQHAPTARPQEQVLVQISPQKPDAADGPDTRQLDAAFWSDAGLPAELVRDALPIPSDILSMHQVMLRQVRDPLKPGLAQHQAVIEVDVKSDPPRGAGVLPGKWHVDLLPSASHPIARTLGLQARSTTGLAFWVEQDFTVDAARQLWP